MFSNKPTTLRFQLTCLVAAAVLPLWIASGLLLYQAYSIKRDQVNVAMLERAQTLTMVVDRELTSVQAALLALATSPSFASGDFAGIHRQTLQLLQSYPGADIIVADASGQQLVNSFLPYGTPLPIRKNPETVRRIFQAGKPVVSDLFYGALTTRPLIGIDVPVTVQGKIAYDLAMTFPSDRLSSVFLNQKLPPDQYGTILDSRLVLTARSRDSQRYVGRSATTVMRQAMSAAQAGTVELINLDGTTVLDAFCRSAMSGWSVVVGVPKASVMTEIYRWTAWVVCAVTLITLFGVALALLQARRIAAAIQVLVGPALTIGAGGLVEAVAPNPIKETGEVASALVQASDLFRTRHAELLDSERRYSSLFANRLSGIAHCRVITDQQGRPVDYWILEVNEAYQRIIGISKGEIEGRRVSEVFPGVENFSFDYIGVLGKIGLEGGEIQTETFLESTGQYLQISAYSPGPGEFTAILTDVTEHRQAENSLKEAIIEAQRFREALDHAPAYIYMKDTQSRYTFANRPTLQFFGCSAEELVGCDDSRFFSADAVTLLRAIDARVLLGAQTTEEVDVLDARGLRHVYLEYKTPVYREPERSTICGVLGISTEITELKQAAENLAGARDALEREVAERTASLTQTNQQLRSEIEERARMEDELIEYQQGLESLTQELSLAEERERGRIAGELHDQVGQHLILGKMKLQWLANELS